MEERLALARLDIASCLEAKTFQFLCSGLHLLRATNGHIISTGLVCIDVELLIG